MSRTKALVLSSVLLLVSVALLWLFLVSVGNSKDGNPLADATFDTNASVLADQVARNGPILFPDLLGKGRDIYVQHLSDDRKEGWRAFRATAPGAGRACTLAWEPTDRVFRDPCSPGTTYPADGQGLEQYQASVQGANKLVIDLRRTVP